jgi:hypothetical protein
MGLLTAREFWLLAHIGLGVAFIHACAGGIWTLLDGTTVRLREGRLKRRLRSWSVGVVAGVAWLAVIIGTWIVYPGYRAKPPAGQADVSGYPRSHLLADPDVDVWHTFGMEWKEHVGWLAPFLATAVAFVVLRHGGVVAAEPAVRRGLRWLFLVAALAALVAASLGAVINKVAPNDFLDA